MENLTITTNLSPDEVRQRLSEVVEPPQRFRNRFANPTKPYQGTIAYDSFEIARIINYRNSFSPIVKGKISPQVMGCEIKVKMRMHVIVTVFMIFWLWNVGTAGVGFLVVMLTSPNWEPAFLAPIGMFVFGYLLCLIGFKIEAKQSKAFLYQLFK